MRGIVLAVSGVVLLGINAVVAAPPAPATKDLGMVHPTPEPTGQPFQKKRLITTLTVQNSPAGESIVTFEATDVGEEGRAFKPLASKQYSLAEPPAELEGMRDKILTRLRELERDLLEYSELAGPPKERAPVVPGGQRPYD